MYGTRMRPGNIAITPWIKDRPNRKQTFQSIENKLFDSKLKHKKEFEQNKNVHPHQFRIGDRVWVCFEKSKIKKSTYENQLYQVTHVRGSAITAQNLENNTFITRHSSFFKLYVPPLSSPNLKEFKADPTDNDFELNYDTVIESDDNENGNDIDRNNDRVHLLPRRRTNREVNRPN